MFFYAVFKRCIAFDTAMCDHGHAKQFSRLVDRVKEVCSSSVSQKNKKRKQKEALQCTE